MNEVLLRVRNLQVEFDGRAAVRDMSFDVHAGETLGLVGESGSGKSTLARAILRLIATRGGSVQWRGEELLTCAAPRMRALRRDLQIVFQNPLASLNPRMSIADAIAEPLKIFEPQLSSQARMLKIGAMLERVGLSVDMGARYPHEFSGGQCQRVGIARAMILNPKLLICDEPVSSLDVSIQGQIVNLLADLQSEFGTAMLFISHDLTVVRHLSRRILVIYAGRCIESAVRDALFAKPLHPYSAALLAAAVGAPPGAQALGVGVEQPAPGCAYRDRCAFAIARCESIEPPLIEISAGHLAACHRAREFCETLQGPLFGYPTAL